MYSWWWVELSPETCRVKAFAKNKPQFLHLVGIIFTTKELHILNHKQTVIPTHTPCSRVLPEKLAGPLLVKKFPAFYGILSFVTSFTRACHVSLSWARSIQSMPTFHILNIHCNIIFPFTPRTSKWSRSSWLPHQNPVCTFSLHTTHMLFSRPIFLLLIWTYE